VSELHRQSGLGAYMATVLPSQGLIMAADESECERRHRKGEGGQERRDAEVERDAKGTYIQTVLECLQNAVGDGKQGVCWKRGCSYPVTSLEFRESCWVGWVAFVYLCFGAYCTRRQARLPKTASPCRLSNALLLSCPSWDVRIWQLWPFGGGRGGRRGNRTGAGFLRGSI
jgi:hypothetical protein